MKHSNLLAGIISAVIGTVSLLSVMIDTGIPHSTFAQAASLEDLTFTVYSDSTTGSTVEELAKMRGIPFELIEETSETTTTSTTRAPMASILTTSATTTRITTTTTIGAGVVVPKRAQKSLQKYDVSGDYYVNIADVVLLTRFLSEENVNISRTGNPDINGDGVVTIEDVQAMLKAFKPFYLKIGKTSAKPGEKVSIPVQVYGDKGTAAGQVYISYDSRLTPVSLKIGDAYTGSFDYEADSFPIYLAWTSQNGLEQTAKDGATLATIEFEVDPNIKQTEYLEIRVMDSGQDYTRFSDSDGFVFTASYRSGYITAIP